jgi:hypothetical protein
MTISFPQFLEFSINLGPLEAHMPTQEQQMIVKF